MKIRTILLVLIIVSPFLLAFSLLSDPPVSIQKNKATDLLVIDELSPKLGSRQLSPVRYITGESIAGQVSDSTITEYINRLVDFKTRFSCTDSNTAASQWIYDKFLEFGFTEVYFDSFPFDVPDFTCDTQWNVVAVKEGATCPDEVIIVGGHYDSDVWETEPCDPDTLAPGADDNASGAVATLEAARVLADVETDATLIFIAFGGEERVIYGSEHYAEEAYNQGMDIRVMINMDMVANLTDDIWDIEIRAPSSSYPYARVMQEIALTHTDLVPYYIEGSGPDDLSFYERGYNTVFVVEWDFSPHLHRCTDTVENVSIPYLTEVTEMITSSLLYFSDVPMIPSGLSVINVGDGTSLYLSWDPNDEIDLAGYRIYWGNQSGVYDSVRTVIATSDTLRNLIEGMTYYIALSAFDTDENESFLTPEAEIITTSIPRTPTDVRSTSLDSTIVIEWEASEGELDLAGYNIYRWTVNGPPDTVLHAFVADPVTDFSDALAEAHIFYGYNVKAVDTQMPPNESEPSEAVLGRLATLDMGVIVVDNTLDGTGAPFSPPDEDVDEFYSDILVDYNVVASWDANDSVEAGRYIRDYDVGIYSVVLWHTDIRGGELAETDTTAMRKYLEGGGNLWLSGWQVLGSLTGESRPYFVFEESSFVSQYIGIDSALTTSTGDQDFIGAAGLLDGFPDVYVDSAKVFPLGALYNTEVLLPLFDETGPLYSYISSDSMSSEYHGSVVGAMGSSNDYGLVLTDFPLYFLDETDAGSLVDAVMELFEEPMSIGEGGEPLTFPRVFSLSQNYPNPFNPSTTIKYDIPLGGNSIPVEILVYDIRGRFVRKLVDQEKEPGRYQVHWDGRDNRGQKVSSGVYLYRIEAGDFSSARKMVLMR
jgi:hypothetical protein